MIVFFLPKATLSRELAAYPHRTLAYIREETNADKVTYTTVKKYGRSRKVVRLEGDFPNAPDMRIVRKLAAKSTAMRSYWVSNVKLSGRRAMPVM